MKHARPFILVAVSATLAGCQPDYIELALREMGKPDPSSEVLEMYRVRLAEEMRPYRERREELFRLHLAFLGKAAVSGWRDGDVRYRLMDAYGEMLSAARPDYARIALDELEKPEPSALVLNRCQLRLADEERLGKERIREVFQIYRKFLLKAVTSDWPKEDVRYIILGTYEEMLIRARLEKRAIKTLFYDGLEDSKRGPLDILFQYHALIREDVRAALSGADGKELTLDKLARLNPFLYRPEFVRDVEAAYLKSSTEGVVLQLRSILMYDIGDAATLAFFEERPEPRFENKANYRKGIEYLGKRLLKEYERVGIRPPAIVLRGPEHTTE